MPTFYYTYVYDSTDFLNAQEVYDFIEKIKFDFLHRQSSAECVDNTFAAVAREIDFNSGAKTFFRNENSGKVRIFFKDAESFEIFVFMKFFAFGQAIFR